MSVYDDTRGRQEQQAETCDLGAPCVLRKMMVNISEAPLGRGGSGHMSPGRWSPRQTFRRRKH